MAQPNLTLEERERKLTSASEAFVRGDLSPEDFHSAEDQYMTDYWAVTLPISASFLNDLVLRLLLGGRRERAS